MWAATLLITATLVLIVDQATKRIVCYFGKGRFLPVFNSRGVLGFAHGGFTLVSLWFLVVLGVLFLVSKQFPCSFGVQVGLGAATGGAGGNVLDRLRLGAVIDFIDLGFWPAFNLADAAIVLGVCSSLLCMW